MTVVTRNEKDAETLRRFEDHIKAELNVKEVLFSSKEDELVKVELKPNFRVLGPIFGKRMGEVSKEFAKLSRDQIHALEDGQSIELLGEKLDASHCDIRRQALSDQVLETAAGVTVFFDTNLTPELVAEGHAREFINRVQKMRKDADYHVSDRIEVQYSSGDELAKSLASHGDFIRSETLALKLEPSEKLDGADLEQAHQLDEHEVRISVRRAG